METSATRIVGAPVYAVRLSLPVPGGIDYSIADDSRVILRVVDLQGKLLWQTAQMVRQAGRYHISPLPSYMVNRTCILEMTAGSQRYTCRMLVIR